MARVSRGKVKVEIWDEDEEGGVEYCGFVGVRGIWNDDSVIVESQGPVVDPQGVVIGTLVLTVHIEGSYGRRVARRVLSLLYWGNIGPDAPRAFSNDARIRVQVSSA